MATEIRKVVTFGWQGPGTARGASAQMSYVLGMCPFLEASLGLALITSIYMYVML